jgi:cytochrome P450 family 135
MPGEILARVALPPGPTASPLLQSVRWLSRPLAFLRDCDRRYGDVFTVRLAGLAEPVVMISNPAAIKALYTEPAHGVPGGRNVVLEPLMGPRSLFLMEGEEHMSRRKLMLPPFHGERMRSFGPLIEEIVTAEIDSWQLGEEFPLHSRAQAVTLEVILRVIFGVADGARRQRLATLLTEILTQGNSPATLISYLLGQRLGRSIGPWRRFEARMREVDEQIFAEIAARRESSDLEEREDFLSMLLLARFEDGEPMSDTELRDQLMTVLLAGHETTATALAWALDLLLRHPEQLRRLQNSLQDSEEDYLKAVIAEVLRMRPLVPHTGRRLVEELTVGEVTLPVGTEVTPAIWLAHTRADVYPEPFAFRPERFLGKTPDTYSWIPFGGGIRRCLGVAFAELEMRIFLREMLTRCDLRKVSPEPEKAAHRGGTFSPRDGTPIVVDAWRRAPEREPVVAA